MWEFNTRQVYVHKTVHIALAEMDIQAPLLKGIVWKCLFLIGLMGVISKCTF